MNARTYDPITGVFMQRDPLEAQFPGWTPYHYVHNNPLNLVDPTGMRSTRHASETEDERKPRKVGVEVKGTGWGAVGANLMGRNMIAGTVSSANDDKNEEEDSGSDNVEADSGACPEEPCPSKKEDPKNSDNVNGSSVIGTIGLMKLVNGDFRAAGTGRFMHLNGNAFSNRFFGNQYISKYSVQAGKLNTEASAKFFGKATNTLFFLSAGLTTYDGVTNGWENHHTADLIISGGLYLLAGTGPVGWVIGGTYLVADITYQYYYGKSITEEIFDD